MPIESTQDLYNLPGPQGWEETRPYVKEKLIPAPLTAYSADRPYGRSASFGSKFVQNGWEGFLILYPKMMLVNFFLDKFFTAVAQQLVTNITKPCTSDIFVANSGIAVSNFNHATKSNNQLTCLPATCHPRSPLPTRTRW